jgi:hypothetical protein
MTQSHDQIVTYRQFGFRYNWPALHLAFRTDSAAHFWWGFAGKNDLLLRNLQNLQRRSAAAGCSAWEHIRP